jgi:hypothetical protein
LLLGFFFSEFKTWVLEDRPQVSKALDSRVSEVSDFEILEDSDPILVSDYEVSGLRFRGGLGTEISRRSRD